MNITPGEPVPPGFEDEVNRSAEIQAKLKTYKENALVGIEYTIELVNDDDREPSYLCMLCDKRGDPRTIIAHWISYNHRLKYLEKHFPTVVRELAPVRYKPDSRATVSQLIDGICKSIEHHYGRPSINVYHADDLKDMRDRILDEIINQKYHYDEKTGPSFTNAIDRDLLNKHSQILQITIKTPASINADVVAQQDRNSLDEISSEDEMQKKNGGPSTAKKKRRSQSPAYKVLPRVRRSPPFEEERSKEPKKNPITLPTPKELSMQANQIAQERYKWEKYRCMLEIAVKNFEKSLKEYEKNPEKHPLYPEEWKKFWNRRYKELQTEKKVDPNKYDYKPEWIVFWTKRMKELHLDEIEEKKKQIKVSLGLNEDAEEKTDMLKQKYKVQSNLQANPPRSPIDKTSKSHSNSGPPPTRKELSHQTKPTAVINISDDEDDRRVSSRSRSKRTRPRSTSRSLSPLSDDYRESERRHASAYRLYERSRAPVRPSSHYPSTRPLPADYYGSYHGSHFPPPPTYAPPGYRVLDPYMYPQYEKTSRFSPPPKGKSKTEELKEEPEDEGPLTVVAVLRLLTALEEHLGSLGPKVVDLLGKALALEKVKANSADEMLMNEDNSVFFETIKEKLKGLLIADVLDDSQKVRAVKKAIKNIAAIIHQVNEKGSSENANKDAETSASNPIEDKPKVPKATKPKIADLPFDRQIVSTKLAAALVMQGREDVSTTDMDKLIYFFVLLVKLSKEKVKIDGKPIQMKNILPELGIAPEISPALVEEIIEQEVATMAAEMEVEMDVEGNEKEANISSGASALESLTDSDLQTLLQNFKHLSTEEQHHLIAHLKKLETADPLRVEKLRKYVNLDTRDGKDNSAPTSAGTFSESSRSKRSVGGDSPRSSRRDHYTDDEASRGSNARKFIDDEDDEEDDEYNFDDVIKAASSNISRSSNERSQQSSMNRRPISPSASSLSKQMPNHRGISMEKSQDAPSLGQNKSQMEKSAADFKKALGGVSIADTQNLIANLMGSLQQSCGTFGNSKSSESASESQEKAPNAPVLRNVQQNAQVSASVPFYQQQQQQLPGQQHQQQLHQQQRFPNYQNMANMNPQIPNQDNFFQQQHQQQQPQQGYNNSIAYPNYNYAGQNLAPFNANFMNQQIANPANNYWNSGNGGSGGYK